MKNIFKKIAVVALVMIMCVSSIVPSIAAAETTCPGKGEAHRADNCSSYTVIAKTEATCSADGSVTGQCNLCGDRFVVETVKALGHDWNIPTDVCEGTIVRTCNTCGKTGEFGDAPGHKWSEWTVTGGVCKVGERRSRTCETCKKVETDVMTGAHNWVVGSYDAPKLCNEPAIANYVCENAGCDAKKTAKLWLKDKDATHGKFMSWDEKQADILGVALNEVKEHDDYKADPNFVEATCSAFGYESMACENCDYVKVVATPKKDHYTPDGAPAGVVANLRFVDEVLEGGCGGTKPMWAYWQCFDCGARFLAKPTSEVKYYAANGTTYPVFKVRELEPGTYGIGQNDKYYPLYIDRGYDMTEIGALVEKESQLTSDVKNSDGTVEYSISSRHALAHKFYDVYKAETCLEDGYYSRRCTWCGFEQSGVLTATGHRYYSDITDAAEQKAVLNALLKAKVDGIKNTTKWADIAPGKELGENITWIAGEDATCEKNAFYYEICINIHVTSNCFDDGTGSGTVNPARHDRCSVKITPDTEKKENVKEYLLSGKGYEALGHEWTEGKGTKEGGCVWTGSPAPTCTASGVYVITCGNCNATKNEPVPAYGHLFGDEVTAIEGQKPTCLKDGKGEIACTRVGCTEKKTVDMPKSEMYHDFKYISAAAANAHTPEKVEEAIGLLACGQSLDIVFSCGNKDCPANANPATYTYKKADHKYADTADAEIYKNILTLNTTNKYLTVGGKANAVEFIEAGDCTRPASYRLTCLNGNCTMFKSFEITEGFNTGAHSIVFVNGADNISNTCTEKEDDNVDTPLNEYTIGSYYCTVKTCPLYSEEGTATAYFKTYSSHLNADGEAISYKDVPDAAISGAASIEEARKVKAPVDENGNVTYAIDIPGTSLVWMYVVDGSCSNDGVALGGFYCVNCKDQANLKNDVKPQFIENDKKADHHKLVVTPITDTNGNGKVDTDERSVAATCTTYGYNEKVCKNCNYTLQYDFVAAGHDEEDFVEIDRVDAGCERDGYVIKRCDDCKEIVTEILKATGHTNGEFDDDGEPIKLTGDCRSDLAINRTCINCTKEIFWDHVYGSDNKCTLCGEKKPVVVD